MTVQGPGFDCLDLLPFPVCIHDSWRLVFSNFAGRAIPHVLPQELCSRLTTESGGEFESEVPLLTWREVR